MNDDNSVIAQLGLPDMKTPIKLALTYPYRGVSEGKKLDLTRLAGLTFESPRKDVFRCLSLAFEAAETGGTLPVVMNAADEEAVAMFLNGKTGFMDIPRVVEETMNAHISGSASTSGGAFCKKPDLGAVLTADRWARDYARRSMNCP